MIRRVFYPATLAVAFLVTALKVEAQNNYFGTWNALNGEYYFDKHWNLWVETQTRSQKFFNDFYYHELKGGVNYKLNKTVSFLLGMGQYGTYSNGGNFKSPMVSHEFRLWEQLLLVNNIDRIKLEHRYRVEQRWINGTYRNRFRYRINPMIPLNKKSMEKHAVFATVYDEVFLTNQPSYFERNRLFGGIGYIFSPAFTVQTGWIRQFDFSPTNPGSKKDFLQTTIFLRLHQNPQNPPSLPSPMD